LSQEQDHQSILDVNCHDKNGHNYTVKIQDSVFSPFIKKLEFYASRTYFGHLFNKDANYLKLKPVILLAIMKYNIFPSSVQCISYHNNEEETNEYFMPNMSYAVIELLKFNKNREQLKTPEDYWLNLFKEAFSEKEPPKGAPDEIQKAYNILEKHTWNPVEYYFYMRTVMKILDEEDAIRTARIQGIIEREIIVLKEDFACKLLEKGFSFQSISDLTGLSVLKVEELSKQ
jgi:predicted transposase/invertase (TIGR01784 family)